jgi:hypothetical protein
MNFCGDYCNGLRDEYEAVGNGGAAARSFSLSTSRDDAEVRSTLSGVND